MYAEEFDGRIQDSRLGHFSQMSVRSVRERKLKEVVTHIHMYQCPTSESFLKGLRVKISRILQIRNVLIGHNLPFALTALLSSHRFLTVVGPR